MKSKMLGMLPLLILATVSHAELKAVEDSELADVAGQGGIYLSGDFTINESGGPMNADNTGPVSGNGWATADECAGAGNQLKCGGRIAAKPQADGGWFVVDDIRGAFSFQGLTLRSREIQSDEFGGDGADFNGTVLEIGLPDNLKAKKFSFSVGSSNLPRPSDTGFTQTSLFQVEINGNLTMQGNVLVFPTGTP